MHSETCPSCGHDQYCSHAESRIRCTQCGVDWNPQTGKKYLPSDYFVITGIALVIAAVVVALLFDALGMSPWPGALVGALLYISFEVIDVERKGFKLFWGRTGKRAS
jgi:uncharacterized protein (DUF983 family)